MGFVDFIISCLIFVIIFVIMFIIGMTIGAICIIPILWWINKIIIPLLKKITD